MTNMEKVAEMLGVKIGEEFNLDVCESLNPHVLYNDGLKDITGESRPATLGSLIVGVYSLEKIEPKQEQKITIVTQVCGYCGAETVEGLPQIVKDTEVHVICDGCLEEKYGIRL